MKNKIILMALSATLFGSISCNDFLDTNVDPDRVDANLLTPNYIFPGAVTGTHAIQARNLNAFAGVQMNSLAGNSYSFGTPFVDDYTPNITSGYNAAIWDTMFRNVTNFQTIIDFKDQNGEYTRYKAMSMIMKAYYVQILTDLYGDMPYTEAFKRELNLSPKYDKGEDIYKASIADLESAVQMITSGAGTSPASADIVFNGDMSKWTSFANAIKLRYLVRMSNVTGEMATYRDQKLSTLAGATYPATDVTTNPGYSSASDTKQNPFTNYWIVRSSGARPTAGNQGYNLYTASEHIALALNGNLRYIPQDGVGVATSDSRDVYQKFNGIKDGRRGRMFTLITPLGGVAADATVEGVRQGATPGQPGAEAGRTANTVSRFGLGLILGNNTSITSTAPAAIVAAASAKPGVLMSKAEIELLLAEAALRYPANISGSAQSHFEAGITASYNYLGASGSAAYITSVNSVPKLGWTGSTDNKIEAIMTQKWIALTGVNPEQSFFDYTRTGYPVTPLATIATGTVKPNRLIYPTSEYASNANNVPNVTAADVFTKNMFTPFWAR